METDGLSILAVIAVDLLFFIAVLRGWIGQEEDSTGAW